MGIKARLSLVTLGVSDVARSERFYRSLGWDVVFSADDGFRVFRTDGAWLTLWPAESLRQDAGGLPAGKGDFPGIVLAMNLDTPADVDEAFKAVVEAGGRVLQPARKLDWGGYTGYVADPDGHIWEIAFNPTWPIGPDGRPIVS